MIAVPATQNVPAHMMSTGGFNPRYFFVIATDLLIVWYFLCTAVMLGVKKSIGLPTRFWSTYLVDGI
jgi:hypothetical protein